MAKPKQTKQPNPIGRPLHYSDPDKLKKAFLEGID